jgi:hypothetical protein
MRVTNGRVVNGKIEVPAEKFTEGMVVTILAPEDRGTFTLGPEAEAALLASTEGADRSRKGPTSATSNPIKTEMVKLIRARGMVSSMASEELTNRLGLPCGEGLS